MPAAPVSTRSKPRASAPSRAFHAKDLLSLQRIARVHSSGPGIATPPFRRFSIFYKLLHKHRDIRPAQNRPHNERNHRNRGQIQQPIANAGIEQRRRFVRVSLLSMEKMSMEKSVGNMRHSHDNLLAQAACAAQSSDRGALAANVLALRPNVQTLHEPRHGFISPQCSRVTQIVIPTEASRRLFFAFAPANASARAVEEPLFLLSSLCGSATTNLQSRQVPPESKREGNLPRQ